MTETAEKSDPKLWEKVKAKVTKGSKGGKPGQWSARKAQLATHEYQAAGGGYVGEKAGDNSLQQWTDEDWGTKSGAESGRSGERYLPKKARAHLSDAEYQRTSDKKQRDTRKGRQFSAQPKDIAEKTAQDRGRGASKADLYAEARRRDIAGRSKMTKAELEKALHR
ncbi:MAG: hypothetical protein V7704_14045 [Aurantimonas endophytica]|uniref:hypothetical protein n=1 Tax=Aurantimonas endophytica TaxID=1522175 RepID=UPI0030033B87